jgi:formylmethanofuran--tetrahydromethanopterin N-formyltransferase
MDGEFVVEREANAARGIAGGNLIIHAATMQHGLAAAQRAAGKAAECSGVILPFPGGVCRSGSKVGSKARKLKASTNDVYCPSLRKRIDTLLVPGANCAYEIVIDGVDEVSVRAAMRSAMHSAAGDGVLAIGAGNYGGGLGKVVIHLRDLVQ